MAFWIFEHYENNYTEIQNFGTGVYRGLYAESNKNSELSSFKTLGRDRIGSFLRKISKLKNFFKVKIEKKSEEQKIRNCVYISVASYRDQYNFIQYPIYYICIVI